MGRSRNPLNEDGSVGKKRRVLPPCRVCGAPGAGFHYGANTCEACKAFFHRTFQRKYLHLCDDGRGACEIDYTNVQLCKRCRYQKCLDIGMSVNAIRTGRYTKAKKSRDQMEIYRLRQQRRNMREVANSSSTMNPTSLPRRIHGVKVTGEEKQAWSEREKVVDSPCFSQTDFCSGSTHQGGYIETATGATKYQQMSSFGRENDCYSHTEWHKVGSYAQFPSYQTHRNEQIKYTDHTRLAQQQFLVAPDYRLQPTEGGLAINPIGVNVGQVGNPQSLCGSDLSIRGELHDMELRGATSRMAWRISSVDQHDIAEDSKEYESDYDSDYPGPVTTKMYPSVLEDTSCFMSPASSATGSETSLASPEAQQCSELTGQSSQGSPGEKPSPAGSSELTRTVESTGLVSRTDMLSISCNTHSTSEECTCSVTEGDQSDRDGKSSQSMCNKCLSLLYKDKDSLLAHLDRARQEFLDTVFTLPPEEELEEMFTEHLEACKVKVNTFGSLRRLPDHEYDQIRASTGIDMDGRHADFNLTLKSIETHIRSIVNFAKHIPGFKSIPTVDKINLIKQSRSEMMFAGIYRCIDSERGVGKMCDNIVHCRICITNQCTGEKSEDLMMEEVETHFALAGKFQKLGLTHTEDTLLHAIILMRPDRPTIPLDPAVRKIYSYLLECLWVLMQRQSSQAEERYSSLIRLLDEARDHADQTLAIYRYVSIKKYSDLCDNPLLHEVLREYF